MSATKRLLEVAAKKQKPKKDPAKEWKQERLKGCKCPSEKKVNKKCPIHGTEY